MLWHEVKFEKNIEITVGCMAWMHMITLGLRDSLAVFSGPLELELVRSSLASTALASVVT